MNLTYLQNFVYQVTKHLSVPFSAAFLIEILSSLQIFQLIFSSMAKLSPSSDFIITSFNKNLRFLTGAFPLSEDSVYNSIFHGIWIFSLIYFALHVILLLSAIKAGHNQGRKRIKLISWLYLLHSRIIFFPLQFFLLHLCNLYNSSKDSSETEFYQQVGWLAGSIILLVLNTSLAFCKEFIFYKINQTESYYAAKTNLYHQLIFIYKVIALLLAFWDPSESSTAEKGSTLFHIIMALSLLSVLYVRLPFYKFSMLKLTIVLSTMMLCLSGISLIYVFTVKEDSETSGGMHILLLLSPTLGIKLILSQFQSLFQRILQGKFMVVDHAIHFSLLIEEFLSEEKGNKREDPLFLPKRESYYGIFATAENKIPLEEFSSEKCQSEIYLFIGNTLRSILLKNPYSQALALFKAQLNLRKLDDIPRTLEILRRFEGISDSLSLPVKGSIRYVNDLLEDFYNADGLSSEARLNLSHYFKYFDIANSVKSLMLSETKKQIEFWEEIGKRDLDAKKMYDRVEEIDQIYLKIRKECERNLNNFRKNFSPPMLLYSVYLNNVRQMHHEGLQMLRNYESIMLAQRSTSANVAVVLVSLDKAKPGLILNAFGSIQDIFNLRKAELVGKKFGYLFPNYIAQNYQQNIQQYAKTPEFKLDFKDITYGKTSNDEIFELEAHFQLYPSIKKELILLVMLKKLDEPAPVLVANSDGHIIDRSKTLEVLFQRESLNVKGFQTLENLNSRLEDVNLAFNTVYRSNENKQAQQAKSWFNSEQTSLNLEESSRWNLLQGLISPDRNKKFAFTPRMTMEKAKSICQEYEEGQHIVIGQEKKYQITAHMSFKPFRFEDEIYKVVSINNLRKDPVNSCFELQENNNSCNVVPDEDDIPTLGGDERVIVQHISPLKVPKTTKAIGSTLLVEGKKPESETEEQHVNEIKLRPKNVRDPIDLDDQRSSMMNSSHLESRAVRTLREIGSRRKLQRDLCSLQISLYVVIAVVLLLSFVKFKISKSSIDEIEKGIDVINLATLRLQNAINTFLWSLVYAQGVTPLTALGYLTASMAKFTESSSQLEHELGLLNNQEFLNRAFQKDIKFWQLAVQGDTKNEMIIDTFVATNILTGKYLAIQEAQSLLEIWSIPDIVLIFNNTANDYLISSNDFISATDTILDEIISKDIVILKVILSIEIVALVAFISIFIMMIWLTSKSYQRLCRALLRSHDIFIAGRITQLNKVKTLLEDDIENKAFIQNGFDFFLEEERVKDVKTQQNTQKSNVQMSSMTKYLVRIAIICLLFIPIFGGLFIATLVKSISTFNNLASVNEELSILSDGSLQSNLLMSTLLYGAMNAGYSSMLIMNKAPLMQIAENFVNFNGLNQRLIETFFSSSKGREIDPFLVEILQTNACEHLSETAKALCQYATNGQNLGLLSINTEYYNILQNIIASVGINTTLADALAVYASSLNKILGEMNTMMEIYPIMMSHILAGFEETAENSKSDEGTYIIIVCVIVITYAVFVYLKPLRDFQKVDLGRRKILKIIPFNIIQGNKALKYYLMQDFKTEVEEIKNKL